MSETHVVIGAGPLGQAVTTQLRSTDRAVRLVNRSTPATLREDVEFYRADVRDEDAAVAACAGATVVYDCVGLPYADWASEFPAVTAGILRGTEATDAQLVVADNLYAYRPVKGPITEQHPDTATDAKGQVRANRARTYLDHEGVPVTIGRASNFFGPGVIDTAPFADPFGTALRDETVSGYGDLAAPHSFCYLPGFAAALVALGATNRGFGEVWHVPHPEPVSSGEFLERIFEAAGTECSVQTPPRFIEPLLGLVNAEVRELRRIRYQFTQPLVVDDAKFADAFGLSPTPLEEAIRNTIAWHRRGDA